MTRLCFAVVFLIAGIGGQPGPPAEAIRITASVNRPAIWVADRVTYTIDVVCPKGLGVLAADFDRSRLTLNGLEVIGSDTREHEERDGTHYTFEYVLTTYRVDVKTPGVGSFQVRYYRTGAGQHAEDPAPAGAVTVPPVAIAFRSLLPDDQSAYDVRDDRPVPPRWLPYRLLAPVGLALLIASAVPAGTGVVRLVRGVRARRAQDRRRATRQTHRTARATLEDLQALDAANPQARRVGFTRLDSCIRAHVAALAGIRAEGMTIDEIAGAIDHRSSAVPVSLLRDVLDACELARYGGPALLPSPDAWREALSGAERIVEAR